MSPNALNRIAIGLIRRRAVLRVPVAASADLLPGRQRDLREQQVRREDRVHGAAGLRLAPVCAMIFSSPAGACGARAGCVKK
jgi:hypothetical protein